MAKSVKKHFFQVEHGRSASYPSKGPEAVISENRRWRYCAASSHIRSYKETVESNLKVGKFIPIILLLASGLLVMVLESVTLIAVCFT